MQITINNLQQQIHSINYDPVEEILSINIKENGLVKPLTHFKIDSDIYEFSTDLKELEQQTGITPHKILGNIICQRDFW